MRKVALKGLAGRKLRSVLTALAIVLGVAMVSGTFVLTDTIDRAFHTIFTSSYSHTDAVISGRKLVDYSASGNATIPASLLAKVRAVPDVDPRLVTMVWREDERFQLTLGDGKPMRARRVVIAAGIAPFAWRPTMALPTMASTRWSR